MSKYSLPYRFITLRLVPILSKKITPNGIVYFGFFIFLPFPILLINEYFLSVIFLLIFSVFLDHLDGDLARYRKTTSNWGALVDMLSDRLRGIILVFSLSYYIMLNGSTLFYLPISAFVLNEFVIPLISRPKKTSNGLRLIYNLDFLGWVPFTYIFPILMIFPEILLDYFYILANIYVLIKFTWTLKVYEE